MSGNPPCGALLSDRGRRGDDTSRVGREEQRVEHFPVGAEHPRRRRVGEHPLEKVLRWGALRQQGVVLDAQAPADGERGERLAAANRRTGPRLREIVCGQRCDQPGGLCTAERRQRSQRVVLVPLRLLTRMGMTNKNHDTNLICQQRPLYGRPVTI